MVFNACTFDWFFFFFFLYVCAHVCVFVERVLEFKEPFQGAVPHSGFQNHAGKVYFRGISENDNLYIYIYITEAFRASTIFHISIILK